MVRVFGKRFDKKLKTIYILFFSPITKVIHAHSTKFGNDRRK